MIGWINLSVKAFITDSFGADAWEKVLAESGEKEHWISSCPYSDAVTYNLVLTGAKILGVTANQALEAYGNYFVKYIKAQVRCSIRLHCWLRHVHPLDSDVIASSSTDTSTPHVSSVAATQLSMMRTPCLHGVCPVLTL
jgi:hypothetical protein